MKCSSYHIGCTVKITNSLAGALIFHSFFALEGDYQICGLHQSVGKLNSFIF